MPSPFRALALATSMLTLTACANADTFTNETEITFEARGEQTADAYSGHIMVPENRANPDSRMIKVEYVRFPATGEASGPPIVYLSGGPGGSGIGTAKGPRFPLFMAMREFGDVIAIDQRGTGASSDLPYCESSEIDPDETPLSDEDYLALYKRGADECLAFWEAEGIDIYGYTTRESARDLDALREHFGEDKISLWGISYGSHLALTAIKDMGDRLDRVVLAATEGLDRTAKLPARTDAYFDRLQDAIDKDEALATQLPDIKAMMTRVHASLDAEPLMLSIATRDGGAAPFLLERRDLQQLTSGMISDPQWAILGMQVYADLEAGNTDLISMILQRFFSPNEPIGYSPMTFAMDVASGADPELIAKVEAQAETSFLKDYLNFPMPQLSNHVPGLDLGREFRTAPVSDVSVLALSGTLDGRTYPESHREALAGLSNLQFVTVENGGHNVFMASPEVTEIIQTFMRGAPLEKDVITVEIPEPDFG